MLKDHEKFIAFVLLGTALMTLAVMVYLHPIPDSNSNSAVLQILNMIIGAFIGAFGAAAQKLFDAAKQSVKVDNPPNEPIPVEPAAAPKQEEELPDYARG